MLAALTTGLHFTTSLAIYSLASRGVPPPTSRSNCANIFFPDGLFRKSFTAVFIRATMDTGVSAGAMRIHQVVASKPFKPSSSTVGVSDKRADRLRLETASGRNEP